MCQNGRVGRGPERSLLQDLVEELIGAAVAERHPAGLDLGDAGGVDVERRDLAARAGEGETEGKTDVSAASDDDDVGLGRRKSLARRPLL